MRNFDLKLFFLLMATAIALHTKNILLRHNLLWREEEREKKKTYFRYTNDFANHFAFNQSEIHTLHARLSARCAMLFRMQEEKKKHAQIGKHAFLKAFYIRCNNNKLVKKKNEKNSS